MKKPYVKHSPRSKIDKTKIAKHSPIIHRSDTGAPRLAAALAIADILKIGCNLHEALHQHTQQITDSRDKALVHELTYGVLRLLPKLQRYAANLISYKLKPKDLDVECLLLIGIYQLDSLRVPDHAAVNQTVAAARQLGKPWASGFVNAILRNFQRRQTQLHTLESQAAVTHCFPEWLAKRIYNDWPEMAPQIMQASDCHPPMWLRVNLGRISRADYIKQLVAVGLTARPYPNIPAALILDQTISMDTLPGFNEGLVSIQDGAAQLAALLLEAKPKANILDACAAPGGKTGHLLECYPESSVTAVEKNTERLKLLCQNLARLNLKARTILADITSNTIKQDRDEISNWTDRQYDYILLDAPCSATGVIRRHPDIKWLRRSTDIAHLVATQNHLLDCLYAQLRPGGCMLYITCSILAQENHEVVLKFLQRTPDAKEWPLDVTWGHACSVGRQILPGEQKMDGFYFARLVKTLVSRDSII